MSEELDEIKGHVVLVMAPTGSGKGTLVKNEMVKHPDMYHTVSCTSRHPRPGEINGKHYNFVTREEFDRKITKGEFLEWAEFAGNKYGTLKSEILPRLSKLGVIILEIELQGVEQLRKLLPAENMTIVYIEAGGWETLKARAKTRAPMSDSEIEARYQRYLIEIQSKPLANVIINNSSDIEVAKAEFAEVINSAYQKCKS